MKPIEQVKSRIATQGDLEKIDITIEKENFNHIFEILTSSLYADPIMAVIRELVCNARDANVENKSSRPIEITKPSRLQPYFVVQDFGKGLSKDGMKKVFASLGKSTKTNTNEAVGFYGIGSKSPFAYTDTYIIESVHDGILDIYSNTYTKEGPAIRRMGDSVETKRESGVTVKVPLKEDHEIYTFSDKIDNFLIYFDQDVKLNGQLISPATHDYLYSDRDYKMYFGQNYNPKIVMGGVAYDLDLSKIDREGIKRNLVIVVPIGSLVVPPNRESIRYTDENIKRIKEAFEKCERKITEDIKQIDFNNLRSATDLYKKVTKIAINFGLHYSHVSDIETPFTYETVDMEDTNQKDKSGNPIRVKVTKTKKYKLGDLVRLIDKNINYGMMVYNKNNKRKFEKYPQYGSMDRLSALNHKNIYLMDTEGHVKERTKKYVETNNKAVHYVDPMTITFLKQFNTTVEEYIGLTVIPFSSLDYDRKERKKVVIQKSFEVLYSGSFRNSRDGKVTLHDHTLTANHNIVYIKCKTKGRYYTMSETLTAGFHDLLSIIKYLKKGFHLVLVKEKYIKDFQQEYPDAVDFYAACKKYVRVCDELKINYNIIDSVEKGFNKDIYHFLKENKKSLNKTYQEYFEDYQKQEKKIEDFHKKMGDIEKIKNAVQHKMQYKTTLVRFTILNNFFHEYCRGVSKNLYGFFLHDAGKIVEDVKNHKFLVDILNFKQ